MTGPTMGIQQSSRSLVLPMAVTAVTVAGIALAAGVGPARATAAGSARWRVVARTNSALNTIVAPAAGSAWALGAKAGPSFASLPSGVHWNGRRWSPVKFPASVKSGFSCSAASSAGNVWAFAGSGLFGGGATYAAALRLSGTRWVVKKSFVPAGLVSGCAVLSSTSAWVFGLTHVAPGLGTWRLKGSSWRRATTGKFFVISSSRVSARDIWAMAADGVGNNDVIAHWNGKIWRSDSAFAAALPHQTSTLTWDVSAINAVAAGNVWVAGQILREVSPGNFVPTSYVLHLSGGKWRHVGRTNAGYYLPGAVSDGHGGWWSQGTGLEFGFGTDSAKPYLLHQAGGRWHRVTLPVPKGDTMQIVDLVHVPGSRAMLAVAELFNGKAGLHSEVLAYGQLPK